MHKITALFVGFAAFAAISTTVATVAEAKGGCGKGWFFDGQRCVPKGEPGYRHESRSHHGGPRPLYGYHEPHYGYHEPHYGSHHHGGVHLGLGSGVHIHLGGD